MNTNQNLSPIHSMMVNPHPVLDRPDAQGRYSTLAGVAYRVQDFRDAEALGLITIHEIGGNELAEMYGRTRVVYSIN